MIDREREEKRGAVEEARMEDAGDYLGFEPPRLMVIGSVEELTQGFETGGLDSISQGTV